MFDALPQHRSAEVFCLSLRKTLNQKIPWTGALISKN